MVKRSEIQRLEALIKQALIRPGVGYMVKRGSGGTVLEIKAGGGGGSYGPQPLTLSIAVDASGSSPVSTLTILPSTIAGGPSVAAGLNWGPYTLSAGGVVYASITLDDNGVITDKAVTFAATLPADTVYTKYVEIGVVTEAAGVYSCYNSRYGPIEVQICRNYGATVAPFYNLAIY